MTLVGDVRVPWNRRRARNRRSDHRRVSLTASGSGFSCLLVPGLSLAVLTQHRLLVAIGVGAGLLVVANTVLAALALRQFTLTASGPDLIEAGERADVALVVAGDEGTACELRLEGTHEWRPVTVPAEGPLSVEFVERSVVDELTFSVRTSYPLGLVAISRSITVKLRAPIVVAPVPIATPVDSLPNDHGRPIFGADDLGGLRPYQPGDSRRDIHWPSVARTGTLMIRERPTAPDPGVAELRIAADEPEGIEPAIGRARSVGEQLLAAGYRIRLDPPPRSLAGDNGATPIRSPRELARRLATMDLGTERNDRATRARSILAIDEKGARWHAPT